MGHRIEKQADHLLIQQRDREVTTQIREILSQKQKKIRDELQKENRWFRLWKRIRQIVGI